MTDYTKVTNFAAKDALSTGNPAKKATGTEVNAELDLISTAIASKLNSSGYTAADVLSKLITVDGSGSGLDADFLDGNSSAAFATASHNHAATEITSGALALANGGTAATSASAARTSLGVTATGADTTYAFRSNNLSDLASASTARTSLGLGTLATQSGTFSGTHSGTSSGTNTGDQTNISGNAATATVASSITSQGTFATKNITVSTSDASGTPANGDVWFKYTP